MDKVYSKHLRNNEQLDGLIDRIDSKKTLEALIRDLILGDLDALINYGYFKLDKLISYREQANKWLSNVPYFLTNSFRGILDDIFTDSLKTSNWNNLRLVLVYTNKNLNGVSLKNFEKLPSNLPPRVEIEILMTLLNIQRQQFQDIEYLNSYWSKRINRDQKPHLGIIFLALNSKVDPLSALEEFKSYHRRFDKMDPEVRMLFQNKFKEITINHFDITNSSPLTLSRKAQWYYAWFKTVPKGPLKDMVFDVIHLTRLNSIRKAIMEYAQDMLIDFGEQPKYLSQHEFETGISKGTRRWKSLSHSKQ